MSQWEYKVVVSGLGKQGKLFGREGMVHVNITMLQNGLAAMGRDGWECCGMPCPGVIVFKRKTTERPQGLSEPERTYLLDLVTKDEDPRGVRIAYRDILMEKLKEAE